MDPGRHWQRLSYIMIAYASTYAILVLPTSIVRWNKFALDHRGGGATTHSEATFAAVSIYHLIELANTLLFFFTRKGLLSFNEDAQTHSIVSSASAIDLPNIGS